MKVILLLAALLALASTAHAVNQKCLDIKNCLDDLEDLGLVLGLDPWTWNNTIVDDYLLLTGAAATAANGARLSQCPYARCPAGFTLDPAGSGTCIGKVWTTTTRDISEPAPDLRVRAYNDLFQCIHTIQYYALETACGAAATANAGSNQCTFAVQDHTHGAPYPYQMRNCMEPFNTVFKTCLKDVGGLA